MKKICLLLVIIVVFFIPKFSSASEVTYFVVYPNNYEYATVSRDDADSQGERLVFEGKTNYTGEICISDWANEGDLKIVEEVPDGYTTKERTLYYRLSDNNTSQAQFVNIKNMNNPNTGGLIIKFILAFMFFIIIIATITVLILNHKKARAITIIVLFFGLLFLFNIVYAAESDEGINITDHGDVHLPSKPSNCIVSVKDDNGNNMTNVPIKIYAEPIRTDEEPSLEINANGGKFFDGKDVMYFRMPQDTTNCSMMRFIDNLSLSQREYLDHNIIWGYKEGFSPVNPFELNDLELEQTRVDVNRPVNVQWNTTDSELVTINGNGGTYEFYGNYLPIIKVSKDGFVNAFIKKFQNNKYMNIGYDDNSSCSRFSYGHANNNLDINTINPIYVCWDKRPDGIYINDSIYFEGSKDTCFKYSNEGDNFKLLRSTDNSNNYLKFESFNEQDFKIAAYSESNNARVKKAADATPANPDPVSDIINITFNKIEIVYRGEVYLTLNNDDFKDLETSNLSGKKYYKVKDSNKNKKLLDYIKEINYCDMCNGVLSHPGCECDRFTGQITCNHCFGVPADCYCDPVTGETICNHPHQ